MKNPLLLILLAALSPLAARAAEQPNIVVILSDDYGYGSVGCYGANPALVKTPNLDRLAAEGRRFTDANTTRRCARRRATRWSRDDIAGARR